MIIMTSRWNSFVIPKDEDSITLAWFSFFRPGTNKPDLIAHENTHVEQFKKEFILFWIKYLFSKNCRLQYECEAYANQIKYLVSTTGTSDLNFYINEFVQDLHNDYDLNFTDDYLSTQLTAAYNRIKGT